MYVRLYVVGEHFCVFQHLSEPICRMFQFRKLDPWLCSAQISKPADKQTFGSVSRAVCHGSCTSRNRYSASAAQGKRRSREARLLSTLAHGVAIRTKARRNISRPRRRETEWPLITGWAKPSVCACGTTAHSPVKMALPEMTYIFTNCS